MIEINLLPERLRKRKKHFGQMQAINLPIELIIGLIGGLICLLIVIHVILFTFTIGMKVKFSGLSRQWQELEPAKKKVDAIKEEIDSIEAKFGYINSLKANKNISWSKKLNVISDSMVRGMWLSRVYFGESVLRIEGSVVSKKSEEMINVGKFASNLKENKDFYSDIKDLELTFIQRRNIKSVEVADFLITAGVKE